MTRVVLAFVLGAAVAAGVVLFVVKRESAPPQPAPVASTSMPAAPAPEAAPPQPAPVAEPMQTMKPAPGRTSRLSPRHASLRTEAAEAPAAPAAPAPAAPQAAPPAQPAAPAPAVARQEQPVAPPPPEPKRVTLTAGTLLSVRLMEALSSDRVQAGDSFSATLDQPVVVDGYVIAERGARVSGKVISAEKAGRVKGLAQLSVELTQFTTSDGQKIHIQTDPFVREGPKSTKSDAAKVGAGAGIGAIIGAIAGGGKGAAIGAGVGGAAGTGTVMATRGKPAVLPVETRLSFRLREPVTVTEKLR